MADNLVRLGFALCTIALISAILYQFGNRQARAVEPNAMNITLQR
ncbi:MAG: hypothetical protein WA792_17290 [Pseudolabrys sp.]